ncbi:Malonyl CoA-acyl carrier protein transacylase,(acyl-carrier-protein) S-malonyltransferase,malonyl CoA-acyl carrier protein transacylase,Acyl transferase domain [Chlamydia poikilotherma]|uniref:Malonyl CoA-acyl carrier protein transacylase n=1 Tax=Chlamydia poikilotherma TaxID=1967783 RepID=A0A3B0PS24_9CHLA|nr:ACP S-malonyltransferase [Chlamydia poikilotherma]SYX08968.1 Malonyl CoA-acyl carrier protein transacylase,(acyl-carrier-protein) S-malonyltransferase,malonyl CoA-acyl carrier protein transacylase,Acyl transferase domain [Chlamydia poikilotherma]
MTRKIGFLFPGQGSQYVGMGKDLVEHYPEAAEIFALADETLGFSLSSIMFDGPEEKLLETAYSQLSIYLHSLAIVKILASRTSIIPTVVSGLSLGEYSALVASGRISLIDGFNVISKRAQFMNQACKQSPGAMAAILGLTADIVEQNLESLGEGIWIANYNAPKQLVIAGLREKIEEAITLFTDLGAKRAIFLKVSGAFHTPLMQTAEDELAPYLYNLDMNSSEVPFVSNVVANFLTNNDEIRQCLVKQMTSPTLWYQSCSKIDLEVDEFLEIGPGKVLAGLNRSIGLNKPIKSLGTVESINNFLAEL